jgi:hypothetical protein
MSLAYSLVNSLAETETEEDLTTLVIDHYTRAIRIPKGITTLGVESDDDVLRLNFKMPRYFGTVDLHSFSIRINYINANGEDDVYKVTDASVVGDNITFSWLVGPTAVAYKGNTKFNVCMVTTNANSVIQKEYNTAITSLPVLEGMECSERVVSEYTDILEQWESRLFGISGTEEAKLLAFSEEQQENIANKGAEVLATIPEDYQTAAKLANEGVRTKADAIICEAAGESIIVRDSSDDYIRGLKIFGKTTQVKTTGAQKLPFPYYESSLTRHGVKFTVNNDGSITMSGTNTATDSVSCYFMLHNGFSATGIYTYKCYGLPSGCVTNIYYRGDVIGDAEMLLDLYSANEYGIVIRIGVGVTVDTTVYPMLNEGTSSLPWEPYTGGIPGPNPEYPLELVSIENTSVDVYGKNLWDHTNDQIDMLNAQGWGNPVWTNNAVVNTLRPNTTYTLSFDVACLEIPEYSSVFSGHCGFVLYSSKPNAVPTVMARYEGDIFEVGDKTFVAATFTTPSNVDDPEMNYEILRYTQRFLKDDGNAVHATVRFENVQLEIGGASTKFDECAKQTLSTIRTLPGIPVTSGGNYTDSDGQQWICDEIDFERGVYVQRIGQFTLTNDRIYYYNTDTVGKEFFYTANGENAKAWETRMYCSHFPIIGGSVSMESDYWMQFSGSGGIRFRHKDLTSLNALATWLPQNSVHVCYVLATPIETPLTVDELAAFQALKTNYPTTTVLNDAGAWMNLRYNADTETWINNLIDEKIAAAVAKL